MKRTRFVPRLFWLLSLTVLAAPLMASSAVADGHSELLNKYRQITPQLADNAFHAPIYLESEEGNGYMQGDVFAILDHRFEQVRENLGRAEIWCEVAPLHLNVKACVRQRDVGEGLTLFVGRKFYQAPKDTYQLDYRYRLAAANDAYLAVELSAEKGPMGTKDYLLLLEATPVSGDKTLVRLKYAYKYGLLARVAAGAYFDTLGHDKIGFTRVTDDDGGARRYITGNRGAIERNAMRYYLAIQTFFDTIELAPEQRQDARLSRWFDLTERYAVQLHEVSKADYLRDKAREHVDQMRLQARADSAGKRVTASDLVASP